MFVTKHMIRNFIEKNKKQNKTKASFANKLYIYIYIYCMYDKLNYEIWVFIIKKNLECG